MIRISLWFNLCIKHNHDKCVSSSFWMRRAHNLLSHKRRTLFTNKSKRKESKLANEQKCEGKKNERVQTLLVLCPIWQSCSLTLQNQTHNTGIAYIHTKHFYKHTFVHRVWIEERLWRTATAPHSVKADIIVRYILSTSGMSDPFRFLNPVTVDAKDQKIKKICTTIL